MASQINDDVVFTKTVTFGGGVNTTFARTQLVEESLVSYPVNLMDLRTWDAIATNLPGTAASDDLSLKGNTFATGSPTIQSSDGKATTITQYARFLYTLPAEYITAGTVILRLSAGMNTTVSDGTATVDVQCYASDGEGGIGSDLCATAAQSINNLTFANKDFTITPSALAPGSVLDVRVAIAITDTATGTAVIGEIGKVAFLLDIRG